MTDRKPIDMQKELDKLKQSTGLSTKSEVISALKDFKSQNTVVKTGIRSLYENVTVGYRLMTFTENDEELSNAELQMLNEIIDNTDF